MPSSNEISMFLAQVKKALDSDNYIILDRREKYQSTLALLGIITMDVIDDIKELSVYDNWQKRPDNNPSFPGDVWICKKHLRGQCIYIKLKIQNSSSGRLLIMSYHIDEV
jgi:hypothetical protein